MQQSLTAPERETVVTVSDADEQMTVWTAQRPMITKLRKNPAAVLLEEGKIGSSVWARFQVPADLLTIRKPRQQRKLTDDQRERLREQGRRLAEARS